LPLDGPAPARPLDVGGLISLAAAVLLLVVPLVLGHEQGWPAWTFISLILSVVAIIAFALIERSVERRGGAPLISERVLGAPGMSAALIAIVLAPGRVRRLPIHIHATSSGRSARHRAPGGPHVRALGHT